MCLVLSSSKSSEREKRVLGKRISGGIDGNELKDNLVYLINSVVQLIYRTNIQVTGRRFINSTLNC